MSHGTFVAWTLAGAAVGAVAVPAIIWVGIALNLKGLRTAYRDISKDATFYRALALLGGSLGAVYLAAIQILDALGAKDPWYGLIMIGLGLAVFWPFVRFLKRHRAQGGGRPQ